MSKICSSKSKKSRTLGQNLWGRAQDAFQKKPYYPGQHKDVRRYSSDYGRQSLKVKRLKAYYLLGEKQMKKMARSAAASLENSYVKLASMLESMIYIAAYRAGFAPTMSCARQLASHGHLLLNGKKVTVKSIKMRPGDVLSLSEAAKKIPAVLEFVKSSSRKAPSYIEVSRESFSAVFKSFPSSPDEVPFESEISISSAVEFYS